MEHTWNLEEAIRRLQEADVKVRQLLEGFAGPAAIELVKARPSEFLNHRDPKVRAAALAEIAIRRLMTQHLADKCEAMAENDTDTDVRGIALNCLAQFYEKKNNRRIGCLFAKVVLDEEQRKDLRWVAYSALSGLRPEIDLSHSPIGQGFSFPEDVDWCWVRGFLS